MSASSSACSAASKIDGLKPATRSFSITEGGRRTVVDWTYVGGQS
jgi:hypothetical protein